jgi:excisionase family DNA binding protein
MNLEQISNQLNRIEQLLTNHSDSVMTFKEACQYTDLSASALYKKTSAGEIPHSKPNGKKIYFSKREIDAWLMRKPIKTGAHIEQEAINHISARKATRR